MRKRLPLEAALRQRELLLPPPLRPAAREEMLVSETGTDVPEEDDATGRGGGEAEEGGEKEEKRRKMSIVSDFVAQMKLSPEKCSSVSHPTKSKTKGRHTKTI